MWGGLAHWASVAYGPVGVIRCRDSGGAAKEGSSLWAIDREEMNDDWCGAMGDGRCGRRCVGGGRGGSCWPGPACRATFTTASRRPRRTMRRRPPTCTPSTRGAIPCEHCCSPVCQGVLCGYHLPSTTVLPPVRVGPKGLSKAGKWSRSMAARLGMIVAYPEHGVNTQTLAERPPEERWKQKPRPAGRPARDCRLDARRAGRSALVGREGHSRRIAAPARYAPEAAPGRRS